MKTLEMLVLAMPGMAYKCENPLKEKKMSEEEVASHYFQLSQMGYENLVSFKPEYIQFKDIPDLEAKLNQKNGRKRKMAVFAGQPISRIGKIEGDFYSTSYIVTVDSPKGLVLPDLEAVQIFGEKNVEEAAAAVQKQYEDASWQAKTLEPIEATIRMNIVDDSLRRKAFQIIDPIYLTRLASNFGYKPATLCFYKDC